MTLTEALAALEAAGKIWSRWLPGMMDAAGRRFIEHADCSEAAWLWVADDGCEWSPIEGAAPNTSNPLTVMGLLLLAREAWAYPLVVEYEEQYGWRMWHDRDAVWVCGEHSWAATEAAAIEAALIAAVGAL